MMMKRNEMVMNDGLFKLVIYYDYIYYNKLWSS